MNIELAVETNEDDWIIGNLKHAGWYRVNYDQNNWNLLIKQLNTNHMLFDATSRAQLVDDSFNLGSAEIIDQTLFLELAQYLVKETKPMVFIPAFYGFNSIEKLIEDDQEQFDLYKVFNFFLF